MIFWDDLMIQQKTISLFKTPNVKSAKSNAKKYHPVILLVIDSILKIIVYRL